MQYLVFTLGVVCCAVALYLNHRDRRDYAKVQAAVDVGKAPQLEEVQLLVADLSQELNLAAEKIVSDLEARAGLLRDLVDEAKGLVTELESTASKVRRSEEKEGYGHVTVLPWDGPAPAISLVTELDGYAPQTKPELVRSVQPAAPTTWRERETAIQEMAGRGMDVVSIAKELNIGKGEVKLILDLKKASAR